MLVFKSHFTINPNSNNSTYRWKGEKRNGEHTEAGRHDFAHPRLGNGVTVADGRHRYNAPPQGVRVTGKVRVAVRTHHILLGQVHKVRAEDESEESDVQRGDEFLNIYKCGLKPGFGYAQMCFD